MITRNLFQIVVTFKQDATPVVSAVAMVTDDSEGTQTGAAKVLNAPSVVSAATTLRDAVMTLAANAGKPVTIGGTP